MEVDMFLEDCDLLEQVQLELFFNKKKISDKDQEKIDNIKKCINKSNYTDAGELKIGSVSTACNVSLLLSSPDKTFLKNVEKIKRMDIKAINKNGTVYLEGLAANKISDKNSFLKFIDKQSLFKLSDEEYDYYSSKVQKCIKNKKVKRIIIPNWFSGRNGFDILYSYDDDCCYCWNGNEPDNISKITVQQLIQASKQSYEDLMNAIKEYDKK